MLNLKDPNVAGLYTGKSIDDTQVTLHSDEGYEVIFHVWEDGDHIYHVFAETDDSTEDFLREHYPDELPRYLQTVDLIPTEKGKWLATINSHIARYTYNRIRPIIEDEDSWLELNEEELDRD